MLHISEAQSEYYKKQELGVCYANTQEAFVFVVYFVVVWPLESNLQPSTQVLKSTNTQSL